MRIHILSYVLSEGLRVETGLESAFESYCQLRCACFFILVFMDIVDQLVDNS